MVFGIESKNFTFYRKDDILNEKGGAGVIIREEYLNKLKVLKDKHIIKIVTGIRRCGKSTLLLQFQNWLIEQGVDSSQIIFINFEDLEYEDLNDYRSLHQYIKEKIKKNTKTYIFLDEIQNVDKFPKVLDSLQLNPDIDLYVTGSNAYMLSSEIATLISGRYIQIEMLPLSFKEYCLAKGGFEDRITRYTDYLLSSSFPYALALDSEPNIIRDYLESIYNTIVIKDIMNRKQVTDSMMLQSVLKFIFDNIGNPFSTKKIADTMTSDGRKIDSKTIEKYLAALKESYVIYQAKRFDIKGKQYLKTLDKYYVVDIGLRYMLLGKQAMDAGHILENIIYLELLRRSYDVYVGKVDSFEVDFVAQNQDGNHYYQVALTVREEATLNRELRPLRMLQDDYPKVVLTLDDDPPMDIDGIKILNARDWLLDLKQ